MTGNDIDVRIDQLAQRDDNDFLVLRVPDAVAPSKPLYILIHPGDAVQKHDDLESCEDDVHEQIFEYSQSCQSTMGSELLGLDTDVWDVAILHRQSTAYTFCNQVDIDDDYYDAIHQLNADENAAILYGDDLDAASTFLLDTMRAKDRPLVVIAGAWSHVNGGCVELVGKRLDAAGVALKSSRGTCISPDGAEEEWLPQGGRAEPEDFCIGTQLSPEPEPAPGMKP